MSSFDPYPKYTPVLRPMVTGPAKPRNDEVHKTAGNALVAAIVGIFICGIFLGPYAIIMGSRALRLIKSTGTGQQHAGKALASIIIGSIATVLHIISAILVILTAAAGFAAAGR